MYLLGYDLGSSSVKAALVDAQTKRRVALMQQPKTEMLISSPHPGWAEQDPEIWWEHVCALTHKLLNTQGVDPGDIKGIGIAYQMHGLVLVDRNLEVLRPSIIWCDSRAVDIGEEAFMQLGRDICLRHLLNSPGNFTASKLKWVQMHEPHIYQKIHKMLLPGDYLAMKLTGNLRTTISGLSEGILWDFDQGQVADFLMDHYGIERNMIPDQVPTFGIQGEVNVEAAQLTGLQAGTPVCYRAGDQPNNALALNVMASGEVAATGGTSGVVYGIVDKPTFDEQVRVNSFAHVNYREDNPSIGVLLCINGAGIQYRYLKQLLHGPETPYEEIEKLAASVPINSEGLRIIPFGNGAERVLGNKDLGSQVINLQLNRHGPAHLYRAALEGIAYSFVYGMEVLQEMGLNLNIIKVGNDNLFQSQVFSATISEILQCEIQMVETTGALGAAFASGIAIQQYRDMDQALGDNPVLHTFAPEGEEAHRQGYEIWKNDLQRLMDKT